MAESKCSNCTQQHTLLPQFAVVHAYWSQPWFNWVEWSCPTCNNSNKQFMGADYGDISAELTETNVPFLIEQYAPDETQEKWIKLYEMPLVKTHTLTRRHDQEATKLGDFLDRTPDEWIWELILEPEPKRELPERWNDD